MWLKISKFVLLASLCGAATPRLHAEASVELAARPLSKTGPKVESVKAFCQQFELANTPNKRGAATAQCVELINSGVSQGRFRFDAQQAAACLDAQRSGANLTACRLVLSGMHSAGQECESANDCQPTLICQGAHAGHNGQCHEALSAGSPCDDEAVYASLFFKASNRSVCASGLHCAIGRKQTCVKD